MHKFNKFYSGLCGALIVDSAYEKEWFWLVVFSALLIATIFKEDK